MNTEQISNLITILEKQRYCLVKESRKTIKNKDIMDGLKNEIKSLTLQIDKLTDQLWKEYWWEEMMLRR